MCDGNNTEVSSGGGEGRGDGEGSRGLRGWGVGGGGAVAGGFQCIYTPDSALLPSARFHSTCLKKTQVFTIGP